MRIFNLEEIRRTNDEKFNDPNNDGIYWTYKITNMLLDEELNIHKEYYGKSCEIHTRWQTHCRYGVSEDDIGGCLHLYRAMRLYGLENFIIEFMDNFHTKKEANGAEIHNIDIFDSIEKGYNITRGGDGFGSGEDHPQYGLRGELSHMYGRTGKMLGKFDEEHPTYGVKCSDEKKAAISRAKSKFTDDELSHIKILMFNGLTGNDIRSIYAIGDDMLCQFRGRKVYRHILPDVNVYRPQRKPITDIEAQELFNLWKSGKFKTAKDLADFYGVKYNDMNLSPIPYQTIQKLILGKTFPHLQTGTERITKERKIRSLTDDNVASIRTQLWNNPHRNERKRLAKEFGVSERYIYDLYLGRGWKNVLPELNPRNKKKGTQS